MLASGILVVDGTVRWAGAWPDRGTTRKVGRFSTRRDFMAKTTPRQRKTTGRIMHEFKHGELKSGRSGKGGKVESRRQAIAIALKEAGGSKYESSKENAKNRRKYERKEAEGKTYQQEREGKSHVGARGRRESTRAIGGKNATRTTARGRKAAAARKRSTSKRGPRA
jgi:hypothetical protein